MAGGSLRLVARGSRRLRFRKGAKPRLSRFNSVSIARGPVTQRMSSRAFSQKDPFPPRRSVILHYDDVQKFTAGSVGVFGTEQIYRLNSLFDPDLTGVGHQPYGFDTLAGIYLNYKVNAVSIELRWTDPLTDGMAAGYLMGAPGSTVPLTGKTLKAAGEVPMIKTVMLNDSGEQVVVQKAYIPMHKLAGLSKLQFQANIGSYSAAVTASPTNNPIIRIANTNVDTGVSGGTTMCHIKIRYYATFYNRRTLAQS